MKKFPLFLFTLAALVPLLSFADTSAVNMRALLIEQYLERIGCLNAPACAALAAQISTDGVGSSTAAATAPAPVTTAVPLQTSSRQSGDGLLQHLATLFVLDSLFERSSDGLVTSGPVTLANLIVLYELFYAPTLRY